MIRRLPLLALALLAGALGCQRCGGGSAPGSSTAPATSASTATASAAPAAVTSDPSAALPVLDVPEVKDTGDGRATAALRAVLSAYGIPFDAAALIEECKVDEEGASIDDLEDVAVKYGLSAGSVIAPVEHVLLPDARILPAVVVVDSTDDEPDFVVAWRLDGDRVQVMDPREGRAWTTRADLEKRLHVHEMTMPADEYREAMAAPSVADAFVARAAAAGVDAAATRALLERAAADPGWRGFAALDAAIRKLATSPGGDGGASSLAAIFACAYEKRCEGVQPVPAALWSAQAAPRGPQGEVQVKLRGALLLAIAGRDTPAGAPDASP